MNNRACNAQNDNTPEFSVVIPVYRTVETLPELCERITTVFDHTLKRSFEIVLIDDASPAEATWQQMCELHNRDQRVKIIRLARNFGQHNALMCGFHYACGEYVVTMDDDLQHPPEEICSLVEAMENNNGVDVVIGAYATKKHSWIRNLGSAAMNWFSSRIFGKDPDLQLTSFRLIRKNLVKTMTRVDIGKPRIGHLLIELSNRIVNVTVNHDERKYGRSGYTFSRLIRDFFANIINNSSIPLQMVSFAGLMSSAFSFLLALFYLYRYFFVGIGIAGWTTLVLLTLFYFGLVLLSLGIIGEYLVRIIREIKRMPQFVVQDSKL